MEKFIYKRPVTSAICIDLLCLSIWILTFKYDLITYSINLSQTFIIFMSSALITGFMNKKILVNGIGIIKSKKILINISMFIMLAIAMIYTYYTVLHRAIDSLK